MLGSAAFRLRNEHAKACTPDFTGSGRQARARLPERPQVKRLLDFPLFLFHVDRVVKNQGRHLLKVLRHSRNAVDELPRGKPRGIKSFYKLGCAASREESDPKKIESRIAYPGSSLWNIAATNRCVTMIRLVYLSVVKDT